MPAIVDTSWGEELRTPASNRRPSTSYRQRNALSRRSLRSGATATLVRLQDGRTGVPSPSQPIPARPPSERWWVRDPTLPTHRLDRVTGTRDGRRPRTDMPSCRRCGSPPLRSRRAQLSRLRNAGVHDRQIERRRAAVRCGDDNRHRRDDQNRFMPHRAASISTVGRRRLSPVRRSPRPGSARCTDGSRCPSGLRPRRRTPAAGP